MYHDWTSTSCDQADAISARIIDATILSTLIYRSRTIHRMSDIELHNLTVAAQSRNRAESITGLVLYDKDCFFQWLEGPAEGLERIMRSIRNDPRHTDIEVLDRQFGNTRVFPDWSMKLVSSGQAVASWRGDVMAPPPRLIKGLRQDPKAASELLATLVPAPPGRLADIPEFRASSRGPLNPHAAAILKTVVVETVIPALVRQKGQPRVKSRPLPTHKRVWELADLLIAADPTAARELIREVQAEAPASLRHYATLFEPVARRLGDLWSEDVCSECDVSLSLARIQTAVQLLSSDVVRRCSAAAPGPYVLVAPEPGEMHGLGAALDSEVMWHVGWNPHCEYPRDDRALEDLVAGTWFDVLDLSLSAAFRREHWLPRLKKTIGAARHASRNPELVIVVGGRLFAEHLALGEQVGADAASTTAVQVDWSINRSWTAAIRRRESLSGFSNDSMAMTGHMGADHPAIAARQSA